MYSVPMSTPITAEAAEVTAEKARRAERRIGRSCIDRRLPGGAIVYVCGERETGAVSKRKKEC